MKNFNWLIITFVIIIFAFIGCSNTIKNNEDKAVTAKKQNDNGVHILRFDKQVYQYLLNPSEEKEDSLKTLYPDLLQALSLSIANAAMESDSTQVFEVLRSYFSHPMLMGMYKDALAVSDSYLSEYEKKLTKAKDIAMDYLPRYNMPQYAMHISGFKENVIVLDDVISLSVERYLGTDYPLYTQFFEPYQIQQMTPEFVVRDYLTAWLMSNVVRQDASTKPTLLSAMVDEGKIKYILSQLLPDNSPEYIIGYTAQQMAWCKDNEKDVWQNILKQNQLFTIDYMIISRYIHDAAYTLPVGRQSPGHLGVWIGWQIVNEYMKKTDASIEELLHADSRNILKVSKYNPN